jgi:NitT/TauT family transport system substrate-binding protein
MTIRSQREVKVTRRSILAGAAASGIATIGSRRPALAADVLTVRLDWSTHGMHAPFFLAIKKGWFKAADLEVKIEDGNGSTTTVQLVGSGQFDIGHAALAPAAMGRAKGLPITSVAGFVRKGDTGVLVPREKGWSKPSDLIGRKVIYTAGSLEGPFVRPFFEKNGVQLANLSLLNVDASAKVGLYFTGEADAAISTVPFILPIAENKRPSSGILFADFGLDLPGFGLVVQPDNLKSKKQAITRFTSIICGAWSYILSGREQEAVEAIREHRPNAPLSNDLLIAQIGAYKPFFYTKNTANLAPGLQSEADWTKTVSDLEQADAIPRGTKATDYFVNDYIDADIFKKAAGQ